MTQSMDPRERHLGPIASRSEEHPDKVMVIPVLGVGRAGATTSARRGSSPSARGIVQKSTAWLLRQARGAPPERLVSEEVPPAEQRGAEEVVREAYRAYERGDRDALLATLQPSVTCNTPWRVCHGREAVERALDDLKQTFELSLRPTSFLEARPDVFVVECMMTFRAHDPRGGWLKAWPAHVITVSDGMIASIDAYRDPRVARRELGTAR